MVKKAEPSTKKNTRPVPSGKSVKGMKQIKTRPVGNDKIKKSKVGGQVTLKQKEDAAAVKTGRLISLKNAGLKKGVLDSKAKRLDAFCPRCKFETEHVVTFMLGAKIRRIKCTACGAEHNFHRSQLLKMRSAKDEMEQAKRKKEEEAEHQALGRMYDEQMLGRDISNIKVYSIKEKFYLEDIVNHPSFGIGLVTKLKEDGKVEVLFKSGFKVLAHNRFNPQISKKTTRP